MSIYSSNYQESILESYINLLKIIFLLMYLLCTFTIFVFVATVGGFKNFSIPHRKD